MRVFFGDAEVVLSPTGWVTKAHAHLSLGTPVARITDRSELELQYHGLANSTLVSAAPTGDIQSGFVYGPYGEVLESVGPAVEDQHRRFNDKFKDDLTRLSYYGVRYRQPAAGLDAGGSDVPVRAGRRLGRAAARGCCTRSRATTRTVCGPGWEGLAQRPQKGQQRPEGGLPTTRQARSRRVVSNARTTWRGETSRSVRTLPRPPARSRGRGGVDHPEQRGDFAEGSGTTPREVARA
ncbi:MAG: hypothetical protein HS111_11325 [Kofleriaceae bacterium]|nr:hypothetical protein [Kofleriaceae bacterium]